MKRQAATLFDDLPSAAEPLFAAGAPVPVETAGTRAWIEARAWVLIESRKLTPGAAIAQARAELREFEADLTPGPG